MLKGVVGFIRFLAVVAMLHFSRLCSGLRYSCVSLRLPLEGHSIILDSSTLPLCYSFNRGIPYRRPLGHQHMAARSTCTGSYTQSQPLDSLCQSDCNTVINRSNSNLTSGISDTMAVPDNPAHAIMALLAEKKLDCVVIDHADPHATECPHLAFGLLEHVSKFTGSWGKGLITQHEALLWTDSRYFIQAERQLKEPWKLMRYGEKDVPSVVEVIKKENLARVAIDPHTTSYFWLKHAKKTLKNVEFVELYSNPLYESWHDRPSLPLETVSILAERYTGSSVDEKLSTIRQKMKKGETEALVLSLLDEVAYVLNLRGNDVECSPLFYSYLVIEMESATLFIDERKLSEEIVKYLHSYGITISEYGKLPSYLGSIANNAPDRAEGSQPYKLWVSPDASVAICNSFLSGATDAIPRKLHQETTPACTMKAVKNVVELNAMEDAHVLDGIALAVFLSKVEAMRKKGTLFELSETALANMSDSCRAMMPGNLGLSFPAISSIGPNSAVVHYRATAETDTRIDRQVYLLDSGGQYPGGTTDVTRTLHFGTPTPEEKEAYTQVLKGHLALRHAIFPEHTSGMTLDILARQFLWKAGRNYYHGTGHGVGSYLNVHEGPQAITSLRRPSMGKVNVVYLEPGMVLSNEPGYYKEGHFGIRIENVVYVKRVENDFSKDHTRYLTFEDLTLVPYCTELIDMTLLSDEEMNWINDYHRKIADTLIPRMKEMPQTDIEPAIAYLREATAPLKR